MVSPSAPAPLKVASSSSGPVLPGQECAGDAMPPSRCLLFVLLFSTVPSMHVGLLLNRHFSEMHPVAPLAAADGGGTAAPD